MAGVAIGPRDVHARAGLHMNFYAGGFSAGIKRNRHARNQNFGFTSQQSPSGALGWMYGHSLGRPSRVSTEI